jgi:hypothetical protein
VAETWVIALYTPQSGDSPVSAIALYRKAGTVPSPLVPRCAGDSPRFASLCLAIQDARERVPPMVGLFSVLLLLGFAS